MKTKQLLLLALLVATPALAGASPSSHLADLAAQTGLSERQVQMVVGGHTAYAEYLTQYDWARRRMISTLGPERYLDLIAGDEIRLDSGRRFSLAMIGAGGAR
ncbi:MAG: hypothetical protein ACJ8GK_03940 [Luteimonas sp.]